MALSFLSFLVLAVASVSRATSRDIVDSTGPFLQQVDNQTWILGNEIWNLTQQVTYGVQLYYKDRDCVGEAVGHYVSYSKPGHTPNHTFQKTQVLT